MNRTFHGLLSMLVMVLAGPGVLAHPGGHGDEASPFAARRRAAAAPRGPIRLVSAPRAGKGLADVGIAEAFAPFVKLEAIRRTATPASSSLRGKVSPTIH